MTPQEPTIGHLDTRITWAAALVTWFISGAILLVTTILSFVGLLVNLFSVGHQERQGISWGGFESPAPSTFVILVVMGVAWLAFTQGWCFMAAAAFKSTYKRAYIGNLILNVLLIVAAVSFVVVTRPPETPQVEADAAADPYVPP